MTPAKRRRHREFWLPSLLTVLLVSMGGRARATQDENCESYLRDLRKGLSRKLDEFEEAKLARDTDRMAEISRLVRFIEKELEESTPREEDIPETQPIDNEPLAKFNELFPDPTEEGESHLLDHSPWHEAQLLKKMRAARNADQAELDKLKLLMELKHSTYPKTPETGYTTKFKLTWTVHSPEHAAEVERKVYGGKIWGADGFREASRINNVVSLVAYAETGKPIGYISFHNGQLRTTILDIAILPGYSWREMGKALYDAAV